jgi:predicted RNA-binding Zn ribbon-like protein
VAVNGERGANLTQPGERQPAPKRLALVQAFVNSFWDLDSGSGEELLGSPSEVRSWLHGRGLLDADAKVGVADLRRALEVREGLRALAFANNGIRTREAESRALEGIGAAVEVRVSVDGPAFEQASRDRVDGAVGLLLAIVAEAMFDGSWRRMKACPGRHCGWVFYDRSRNGTGRWCSMSVCGGREKARAYYRRRTVEARP